MMEWTDRHCRYLHRLYAPQALLYTEMIVAAALVRGDSERLLRFDPRERPVALQLGGCDPQELALAARIGRDAGYAEINLNVGCPSDRVRNGSFGACLMLKPALVADCVRAMREVVSVPVTVKCRIGIDEREDYDFFADFVEHVVSAGADALIVHARNAVLSGLSPKENREIPPLKYGFVHRLKRERPLLPVVLNGGLADAGQMARHIEAGLDGVMVGRAAYHRPELLAELHRLLVEPDWQVPSAAEVVGRMAAYAEEQRRAGVRLHSITRHMHGIAAGRQGARAWRRFLSQIAARPEARAESLISALPMIQQGVAA